MSADLFNREGYPALSTAAITRLRFVKISTDTTATALYVTAATTGEYPIGIAMEAATAADQAVSIATSGSIGMLYVDGSSVAITEGDFIKATTAGAGIKATSGDVAAAIALRPSAAAGDIIPVLVIHPQVVGTPAAGTIKTIVSDADGTAAISADNLTAGVVPVVLSYAGAVALSIPATTSGNSGTFVFIKRTAAGTVTITPASGTIGGASTNTSLTLAGEMLILVSDFANTDWKVFNLAAARDLQPHSVPLTDLFIFDSLIARLGATPTSADDLSLITGTAGTDAPEVRGADAKAATKTQKARFFFTLPANYRAGEDIKVRINAGMMTTVSDGTATVDVECFLSGSGVAGAGSDICATAAQSINSLTEANKDFVITATGRAAGDILDVIVTLDVTDSATGTAVIALINNIQVLLDVNG